MKHLIAQHSIEYLKDGKRDYANPDEPFKVDDELAEKLVAQGAARKPNEGEMALIEKREKAAKAAKGGKASADADTDSDDDSDDTPAKGSKKRGGRSKAKDDDEDI